MWFQPHHCSTTPYLSSNIAAESAVSSCQPNALSGAFSSITFALDPDSTKLMLPASCIRKTLGLHRTHPTPSLCRLFLQGRCRQGSQCHQIHADLDVVLQLRQAALASPPCCQMHTPWAATELAFAVDVSRTVVIGAESIPVAMFCPTAGLHSLLRRCPGPVAVCDNDLCRNHRIDGLCRFGSDCSYLHLCTSVSITHKAASSTKPKDDSIGQDGSLVPDNAAQQQQQQQQHVEQQDSTTDHHRYERDGFSVSVVRARRLHTVFRDPTLIAGGNQDSMSSMPMTSSIFIPSMTRVADPCEAEKRLLSARNHCNAITPGNVTPILHQCRVHCPLSDSPDNSSINDEDNHVNLCSSSSVSSASKIIKMWSHNPYTSSSSSSSPSLHI